MSNVSGVGGPGGPAGQGPVIDITAQQLKTIKDLIAKSKDEVNTNRQQQVVDQIWDNLRPAIVARYIAPVPHPPVARYLVPPQPRPDDDIVAEYIAVAPGDLPTGYNPGDYTGITGQQLVDRINARERGVATDAEGRRFPDDMVMFYLVAPPPDPPVDPQQLQRFNQLRTFDIDMNKTFKALLETAEKVIADGKIHPEELDGFSRLHYAFDLCAKLFFDGVREYRRDYPLGADPQERPDWRTFSDQPASGLPGSGAPLRSDSPTSVLGVQSRKPDSES